MKIRNICAMWPCLLLALLLSSCDEQGYCLGGEGDIISRNLDLAAVEGVAVSGGTRVYIERGAQQQVEVRGQQNILDELRTEVRDGIWQIEFDRCLRNHETVEVYLTVPDLREASVGGSGRIEVRDLFRSRNFETAVSGSGKIQLRVATERLEARISGSGTINAAGMATQQSVRIYGSGNYEALDLESRETEVHISGSGDAEVDVQDELDANISGSGRVYYTGSPGVNSSVSGSGKLIKK